MNTPAEAEILERLARLERGQAAVLAALALPEEEDQGGAEGDLVEVLTTLANAVAAMSTEMRTMRLTVSGHSRPPADETSVAA